MRRNAGFTRLDLIVIIILCALVLIFLSLPLRDNARRVKCRHNLSALVCALDMYLNTHGGTVYFPVPAQAFRGDCWLAMLYWTDLCSEPRVFQCPGSGDHGTLPAKRPPDLSSADAIPPDAISYAGRCAGLTGDLAHRNTPDFAECGSVYSTTPTACPPVASDDNEGPNNHKDGINVVYGDSHVEFIPSTDGSIYDQIGKLGGKPREHDMPDHAYPPDLGLLDSGETPLETHRPHAQSSLPPWVTTTRITLGAILVAILIAAAIILRRPLRTILGFPARGPSAESGERGKNSDR